MDPLMCEWSSSTFLIFSENVFSSLIYYSHLGPLIASVLLGFTVLFISPRKLINRLLFTITVSFSLWVFFDLILWSSEKINYIMFFWSIIVPVELLLYASSVYLVLVFANKNQDISLIKKVILFCSFIPVFLFSHTSLNLLGFDYSNCDRAAIEGPLIQYLYFVEILFIAWIFIVTIFSYRKMVGIERRQFLYVSSGIIVFLLVFSGGNAIISYFSDMEWFDWSYEQYKLFGMPILVAFITYSSVKFKTFNLKIIGSQALVITLWILIGSLLFVAKSNTTKVVAGATLALVIIFGFMLVRSVKKEVKQREEIESLAENLKRANDQLKVLDKMKSEFVSIASHQLRSPLTSIRGYASMITEGTYGKVPAKAQAIVEKISESAKYMALSIEDYLNVSRIEAGNMKYELTDFNVKEMAEKLVDELRPVALKKGLLMLFRSDCDGSCVVHADIGKTRQVLMNLIDNAMKYTPKGTITVVAHDDIKKKKMYVTIQDTGVGMSEETVGEVFNKFVRAKNANCVNVTGTGLGLYVAKKMIDGMNGRVWAESAGEGKGSAFHIELQLLPGNPSGR